MKFFDTINLVWAKRRTVPAMMPGLSPLAARAVGVVGFGRLDDVGGWRLGGVGGVFGKASHLFGKVGDLVAKCGVLFGEDGDLLTKFGVFIFEFCDPSQIELFFGWFHRPLCAGLPPTPRLSDARGRRLESGVTFH